MIAQLAEGIESLLLPCSWILVFAGAALSIYARRRSPTVIGSFVLATAFIAWLRFSGWWFAAPSGWLQVTVGVVIISATVTAWKLHRAEADAALGALIGTIATWSWLPCVGPELANILNDAPDRPLTHIAGTVAFVVGLLLPFLLVAAIDVAMPSLRAKLDRTWVTGIGAVLLVGFGVFFASGWSDDLTSELFSRSSF